MIKRVKFWHKALIHSQIDDYVVDQWIYKDNKSVPIFKKRDVYTSTWFKPGQRVEVTYVSFPKYSILDLFLPFAILNAYAQPTISESVYKLLD